MITRIGFASALTAIVWCSTACAEIPKASVKIGVLTDLTGAYSAPSGKGSVDAVRMAVEDWGEKVKGKNIEVISADTLLKPDVAAGIARRWIDVDGVDIIVDLIGSAVGLAVQEVGRQSNKMIVSTGAASSDLVGKSCARTGIQWLFSSAINAQALGKGIVGSGADSWYFLAVDTAGGKAIENDTGAIVRASGGKVLGSTRYPMATSDFSSFLLQAQAAKPKVIALADAGDGITTALKQAAEFNIAGTGTKFVAPFVYITEVHALGLAAAQGLLVVETFYWDQSDETRAFSKRFFERNKVMPTQLQAGDYTAVTHFLKAVEKTDSVDGPTIAAAMREIPINDFSVKNGRVRDDGSVVRDRYIYEVKKPSESKAPWDYYKVVGSLKGGDVLPPLSESQCSLIKK